MAGTTQEVYSEVYSILNLLGEDFIKKLPKSLYEMIKKEKSNSYNPQYREDRSLNDQNIKRETLSMIALFHLNYWCNSEEEKNDLKLLFKTNEEKHHEEISKKYNPDDLFKKHISRQEESIITNEVFMVEYKEPFLKRIFNNIKRMFHIN